MEVTTELMSTGVYLSGDQLTCDITFRNVGRGDEVATKHVTENLAWASAQLQCICQMASNAAAARRDSESSEILSGNVTTSLQPQRDAFSHEVAATQPKILFCDLTLLPGESRTFRFEAVIPVSAPHSYHGRGIKYTHRVIVASQRLNCNIATLKVPFRVLSVAGLSSFRDSERTNDLRQTNPPITNPFLAAAAHDSPAKDSSEKTPESVLSMLQEPSARRVATYYNIKNTKGLVGKLCLFKTSYRLGEDVIGLFDFTGAESQCMQFSVSLYVEEQLLDESLKSKAKVTTRQSCQEFSFGYDETNFALPIPLHATPSFADKNCKLTWMLRFEFVISASGADPIPLQPVLEPESTVGHEWNGPAHCQVETMTWNLPITVLPTNPKPVASLLQTPIQFSMII